MAQVSVSIGGKPYRLACNPGEEPHLESLARLVDAKIEEMRAAFGEIGDPRLVIMAALKLADELFETRGQAETSARRAAEQLSTQTFAREAAEKRVLGLNNAIREISVRVEGLAAMVAGEAPD
jgi:cell division protein ZapA